jgi:hypothetical protein
VSYACVASEGEIPQPDESFQLGPKDEIANMYPWYHAKTFAEGLDARGLDSSHRLLLSRYGTGFACSTRSFVLSSSSS